MRWSLIEAGGNANTPVPRPAGARLHQVGPCNEALCTQGANPMRHAQVLPEQVAPTRSSGLSAVPARTWSGSCAGDPSGGRRVTDPLEIFATSRLAWAEQRVVRCNVGLPDPAHRRAESAPRALRAPYTSSVRIAHRDVGSRWTPARAPARTAFCECYRAGSERRSPATQQVYIAGNRLFINDRGGAALHRSNTRRAAFLVSRLTQFWSMTRQPSRLTRFFGVCLERAPDYAVFAPVCGSNVVRAFERSRART